MNDEVSRLRLALDRACRAAVQVDQDGKEIEFLNERVLNAAHALGYALEKHFPGPAEGELGWRCMSCLQVFKMEVDASIRDGRTFCRTCAPVSVLDDDICHTCEGLGTVTTEGGQASCECQFARGRATGKPDRRRAPARRGGPPYPFGGRPEDIRKDNRRRDDKRKAALTKKPWPK